MSTSDTRLRFLGHFNGTDGSKTIVDDSTYSNTVTNNSSLVCELDTGIKKFGTTSLMCDLIVKDTEAGTDDTQIVITGHGLSVNDKITLKDVFVDGDSYETTVASVIDSDTFTVVLDITGTRWGQDFQKFGSACGKFDGSGDYLSIADSSDWDFGSGDFTIDCWIYPTSLAGPDCIISQRSAWSSNHAFGLYIKDSNELRWTMTYNGSSYIGVDKVTPVDLQINTWQHVAVVRNGTDLSIYLDGVLCTSAYNISTNSIYNSTAIVAVGGGDQGVREYFQGYMDEVRVSKGIARWTSNFTPPTAEYTSDANTQLLLHMNGTSGSTTFTDDGNTGHTVTANGDAQLYGTSSDGSGEIVHYYHEKKVQLALPSNNLKDNVTFRFWFQFNDGYPAVSSPTNTNIIGYDNSGIESILYMDTNKKINVEGLQSTTALSTDTWYFIQYSAGLNKHWLHIDGVLEDSEVLTTPKDYTAITNFYLFDETANDNNLDSTTSQAWIDDLQFWETALYGDDNFTPPIAEYSDSEFSTDLYITNYGLQVDIAVAPPELYITNYGLQVDVKLAPPELYVTNYGLQVDVNLQSLSSLKFWDGGAWVVKPLKFWNGSSWEEKPLKYHNGSEWL